MKRFIVSAILLCIVNSHNYAQFRKGMEMIGVIYLKKDPAIVTPFIYLEKEQVLLVKDSLHFAAYTTFHVDSFFYYDPKQMLKRRFKKLEYQQRTHFFEVVANGKLEILRLKLTIDAPERVIKSSLDRHRLNYDYFVWHDGELSSLQSYKAKTLKKKYPQLWKEIHLYMRDQNFIFHKLHHKFQIILKVNDLLNKPNNSSLKG